MIKRTTSSAGIPAAKTHARQVRGEENGNGVVQVDVVQAALNRIDAKLEAINERLDKLDGRVTKEFEKTRGSQEALTRLRAEDRKLVIEAIERLEGKIDVHFDR